MPFFEYRGIQVFYTAEGSGPPVILLHGNTAAGAMLRPLVPLYARFRTVIVPDLPGCGLSERYAPWPADLWYDWGEATECLRACLGFARTDVIGTSGGALAALNWALEHPGSVGAVIADSFEGLRADPDITRTIFSGRESAKRSAGFREYMRRMHGDDWESVIDADTDAVARHAAEIGAFFHRPLGELRVPLLATGSREDSMFPAGHYERLFEEVRGLSGMVRTHIFERGDHPAMLSSAEEFASLAEAFLAGHGIGTAGP
jgi:pimeloyl-ACP methyl ester carboxylesterase